MFSFPLYQRTPLDVADANGHKDIVEYLKNVVVSTWDKCL